MYTGRIVFSQLMDIIPKYKFQKIVDRYNGNYRVRRFTCWQQLLCLCFGQLTFRESLRDLTSTLNALDSNRYHMGITHKVSRSIFADANANRPWQMYQDLALLLIDQARKIVHNQNDMKETTETIYALDSTTIDLCLSLFPWAEFRAHKAAVKLHTLMDLEGYTHFYPYFGWTYPRCECLGSDSDSTGKYLHYGSWICGLSTPLQASFFRRMLCYPSQKEPSILSKAFYGC